MMNCEDVGPLLTEALDRPDSLEGRRVLDHLAACAGCSDALRAVSRLRSERDRPVPVPRRGAFERAVRAAAGGRRRAVGFWEGIAVGAAAAAAVAALAVSLVLSGTAPGEFGPPEVTLAMHEARDVSVAIDAPAPLLDAEIQVTLRGAVELRGFEGQRDIHWTTDLEQGVNQLTLPVMATGQQGGQVQIAVNHGNKRKIFLIDVHATLAESA